MNENKFEDFPLEYEKLYSEEKLNKKCDLSKVTPYNDVPLNTTIYLKMFQETANKFQKDLFDSMVKLTWLKNRFCYFGHHRSKLRFNGKLIETAYSCFMRRDVGLSNRIIFNCGCWIKRITSYFKDFFPNFDEGNPFEENYEYPFKHMNFDCLLLVNGMPERMELLKRGEERKMNSLEFTDYVINYINCYNAKHGKAWEKLIAVNNFDYIRRHRKETNE